MKNEKTKGGYIAQSVASLIAAILIALLLFAAFSDDLKYLFGKAENMNTVLAQGGPEKGQYVSVGVDAVVDWYAETTYKINGIIPAGSKWHCLIWLDDDSFISLSVKGKKNKDIINGLINDTEKYINNQADELPAPVVFEGKITSIGSDGKKFYNDALRRKQLYDKEVRYLTIDTSYSKTSIIIYGIIALAVIGGFIGAFIGGIKGVKRLKAAEKLAASAAQSYNQQGFGVSQTYNTYGTDQNYNAQYDNSQSNNIYDNSQGYNTYDNNQGGI